MLCVLLPCACDVKLTWCCVCIVVPTGCPKINRLAIDRFRFGLQWCLAKAVDLVSALPASTLSGWPPARVLQLFSWHFLKPELS